MTKVRNILKSLFNMNLEWEVQLMKINQICKYQMYKIKIKQE